MNSPKTREEFSDQISGSSYIEVCVAEEQILMQLPSCYLHASLFQYRHAKLNSEKDPPWENPRLWWVKLHDKSKCYQFNLDIQQLFCQKKTNLLSYSHFWTAERIDLLPSCFPLHLQKPVWAVGPACLSGTFRRSCFPSEGQVKKCWWEWAQEIVIRLIWFEGDRKGNQGWQGAQEKQDNNTYTFPLRGRLSSFWNKDSKRKRQKELC